MLDGRVARLRGRSTSFGAYLDSTMDRYSDMVLYMGLLVLYARVDRTPHMVLCWVAAFGSFMTSYARARAESLVPRCPVGMLERPERIVLIVAGALTNRMVAVLWVIAVLANITAVQRVVFTLRELQRSGDPGAVRRRRGGPALADAPPRALPPGPAEDAAPGRGGGLACATAGRDELRGLAARRLADPEPLPLDLLRRPGHGRGNVHGAPAALLVRGASASVSMIVTGLKATFTKRIVGESSSPSRRWPP